MFLLRLIWAVVHALFANRADLVAENLALRQQLIVLQRKVGRPRLVKARDKIVLDRPAPFGVRSSQQQKALCSTSVEPALADDSRRRERGNYVQTVVTERTQIGYAGSVGSFQRRCIRTDA